MNYTLPYMVIRGLERTIQRLAKKKEQILSPLRSIAIPDSAKRKIQRRNLHQLEKVAPKEQEPLLSAIEELFSGDQASGLLGKIGIGKTKQRKIEYLTSYLLTTIPPTLEALLKRAIDEPYLAKLPTRLEEGHDSARAYVEKRFFFPRLGKRYLASYTEEEVHAWIEEILGKLKGGVGSFHEERQQLKATLSELQYKLREQQNPPEGGANIEKRLETVDRLEREIRETKQSISEVNEREKKYEALTTKVKQLRKKPLPRFNTIRELSLLQEVEVQPFENPFVQHHVAKAVLEGGIEGENASSLLRSWVEEATGIDIKHTRSLVIAAGKFVDISAAEERVTVEQEVNNDYTLKPWVDLGNVDVNILEEKRKKVEEEIESKQATVAELRSKKLVSHFLKVEEDFWGKLPSYEQSDSLHQRRKNIADERASSTYPYGVKDIPLFPEKFDKPFTRAYAAFIQGHQKRKYDKEKLESVLYSLWTAKGKLRELHEKKTYLDDLLQPPGGRVKRIRKGATLSRSNKSENERKRERIRERHRPLPLNS